MSLASPAIHHGVIPFGATTLLAMLWSVSVHAAEPAPAVTEELSPEAANAVQAVHAKVLTVRRLLGRKDFAAAYEESGELHDVLDVEAMRLAAQAALASGHDADTELLTERLLSADVASMGDALAWIHSVRREGDRTAVEWARKVAAGAALPERFTAALSRVLAAPPPAGDVVLGIVESLSNEAMPPAAGERLLLQRAYLPTAHVKVADRTWAVGYAREGLVARSGDEVVPVSLHGDLSECCGVSTDAPKPGATPQGWGPQMRLEAGRPSIAVDGKGGARYHYVVDSMGEVGEANPNTSDTTCGFRLSPVTIIEDCDSGYSGGAHPDTSSTTVHYSLRPGAHFARVEDSCAGAEYLASELERAYNVVRDQCSEFLGSENKGAGPAPTREELVQMAVDAIGPPKCDFTDYKDGHWMVVGRTYAPRIMRGSDCDQVTYQARMTNPRAYEAGQARGTGN